MESNADTKVEQAAEERSLYRRDIKVLAVLAALFLLISLIIVGISPPHEGDSSEYAAIARNILRYGDLREYLLKSSKHFTLTYFYIPHPVTSREAFMPFVLLPFYLLFGTSFFSMAIPGALAFFAAPLLTYIVGYRFFGRRVSFWAAFLTLFSGLIASDYLIHEPCEPEMFLIPLYLLTAYLFISKRYVAAGVCFALAFLMRQSAAAIFPSIAVFVLLFDRRRETLKGTLKFLAIAFLLVCPLLIRNTIVFHKPFYSEQTELVPRMFSQYYGRIMAGRVWSIEYNYELLDEKKIAALKPPALAERFVVWMLHSLKWSLFGRKTEWLYQSGLVDVFFVFGFVFLIIGMYHVFREKRYALFPLLFLFHCALLLLRPTYNMRYMFPVFPIGCLLALYGLARSFSSGAAWLRGISLYIFAVEFAPFMVLFALSSFTNHADNNYNQLRTLCEWQETRTRKTDIYMGLPYSSINYLCDRPVISFPGRDIETYKKVTDRFRPKYMVYAGEWNGDQFPLLSGMLPVASNGKTTLFAIDAKRIDPARDAYLKDTNFFDYFMASRFRIDIFPPLNRALRSLGYRLFTGGDPGDAQWKFAPAAAAWVFACAVWLALLFVFIRALKFRPSLRGLTVLLIFFFSLAVQIAVMLPITKSFSARKPPVSVVQLFRFLEHLQEEKAAHGERRRLAVAMNENSEFLRKLTESHPEKARFDTILKNVRVIGNEKFDANMKTNGYDALIYFDPLPGRLFSHVSSVGENHRDIRNYLRRLENLKNLPGLRSRKSILLNGAVVFY